MHILVYMHHILRNTLLALIIATVVTSGGYFLFLSKGGSNEKAPAVASLPKQEVAEAQEKDRVVTSLDGSKSLTLKLYHNSDNSTTYSFVNTEGQQIYAKTLAAGSEMDIPDNSWAPQEKYLFVEENGGGLKDVLVLQSTGEPFGDGQTALNVGELFKAKEIPYTFNGATGWADTYLLIIETLKADGSKGPSYWFDVSTRSFIQLATRF